MNKIQDFFEECPAAILCGILEALLFGVFLTMERFTPRFSKELFFLQYPETFRFTLGIILLVISLLSLYKPLVFGLPTTYMICVVRIIDSIQLHGYIRATIWIIIMLCATWGLIRKYTITDAQRVHHIERPDEMKTEEPNPSEWKEDFYQETSGWEREDLNN